MALTCSDPSELSDGMKCFLCLDAKQQAAATTYLLAVINGGSLDPAVLIEAAKCFLCLDAAQHKAIQTYLLCKIAP